MSEYTIFLSKEDMKFSIAHFTVFSSTKRERLHGHNYYVNLTLQVSYSQKEVLYDYNIYKRCARRICQELDEFTILPGNSPFLSVEHDAENFIVRFNQEKLIFSKRDTKILPVANVTCEDLADWFMRNILEDEDIKLLQGVRQFKVDISSGKGQSVCKIWETP